MVKQSRSIFVLVRRQSYSSNKLPQNVLFLFSFSSVYHRLVVYFTRATDDGLQIISYFIIFLVQSILYTYIWRKYEWRYASYAILYDVRTCVFVWMVNSIWPSSVGHIPMCFRSPYFPVYSFVLCTDYGYSSAIDVDDDNFSSFPFVLRCHSHHWLVSSVRWSAGRSVEVW